MLLWSDEAKLKLLVNGPSLWLSWPFTLSLTLNWNFCETITQIALEQGLATLPNSLEWCSWCAAGRVGFRCYSALDWSMKIVDYTVSSPHLVSWVNWLKTKSSTHCDSRTRMANPCTRHWNVILPAVSALCFKYSITIIQRHSIQRTEYTNISNYNAAWTEVGITWWSLEPQYMDG